MRTYLTFIIFFISLVRVNALEMSEINYDPAGSDTSNEWVEIYNDTALDIDLTTYKFFENNVNHGISAHKGGAIISAGEYVVLADNAVNFVNSHVDYAGKVFDSAFSLSNSGELLELKNSSAVILFSVMYKVSELASNTGGTLNYIKSSSSEPLWAPYAESPGIDTPRTSVIANNSNPEVSATSSNTNASNYSIGYSSRTYTLGDLNMLTPKEIYTAAGAYTNFFVKPIDSKRNIVYGNTYWSFGDGASGAGASTTHKYSYAGVYTAYVETEVSNAYGIESIKVTVVNPDIAITEVGVDYVMLKNNSEEDLNIGGFSIGSDQGFFKLSRQLIIKSQDHVRVDGRALGFSNLTGVKLLGPDMSTIIKHSPAQQATSSLHLGPSSTRSVGVSTIKKPLIKKISARPVIATDPLKTFENKSTITKSSMVSTNTVQIPTIKKSKNWLYWLYD